MHRVTGRVWSWVFADVLHFHWVQEVLGQLFPSFQISLSGPPSLLLHTHVLCHLVNPIKLYLFLLWICHQLGLFAFSVPLREMFCSWNNVIPFKVKSEFEMSRLDCGKSQRKIILYFRGLVIRRLISDTGGSTGSIREAREEKQSKT